MPAMRRSLRPALLDKIDWSAIETGALVGAVVLAVVAVLGRVTGAVDDETMAIVVPLLLLALVGLGAAGWVAARRCRRAPLLHAVGAAAGAVLAVEVVTVVRLWASGDSVPWAEGVVWLLLAGALGTAGGLVALRPRREAESPG